MEQVSDLRFGIVAKITRQGGNNEFEARVKICATAFRQVVENLTLPCGLNILVKRVYDRGLDTVLLVFRLAGKFL